MKKFIVLCLLILIIIPQTGCDTEPYSKTKLLLDTTCTITIYDGEIDGSSMREEDFSNIASQAFDLISYYQLLFTKEESNLEGFDLSENVSIDGLSISSYETDILNINNNTTNIIEISDETYDLLSFGLTLSEETEGMFDVTVGAVSSLWDFSDEGIVPSNTDIEESLSLVSYEYLSLTEDNGKYYATLSNSGSSLDLGAIAKGYIADKVSDYLISQGVTEALVNLGGNNVAIGSKNGDEDWSIGVETSFEEENEIIGILSLANQTVATSGIYERQIKQDGVSYHHVLDPTTGYPCETDLISVTIIGDLDTSYIADGLSTVCLLLGKDEALEHMKKYPDFQYILVCSDGSIVENIEDDIFEYI